MAGEATWKPYYDRIEAARRAAPRREDEKGQRAARTDRLSQSPVAHALRQQREAHRDEQVRRGAEHRVMALFRADERRASDAVIEQLESGLRDYLIEHRDLLGNEPEWQSDYAQIDNGQDAEQALHLNRIALGIEERLAVAETKFDENYEEFIYYDGSASSLTADDYENGWAFEVISIRKITEERISDLAEDVRQEHEALREYLQKHQGVLKDNEHWKPHYTEMAKADIQRAIEDRREHPHNVNDNDKERGR